MTKGLEAVCSQIGDGKAKLEVAPHEVAVLQMKLSEIIKIEKSPDVGVLRGGKKRSQINRVLKAVIEPQPEAIPTNVIRARDVKIASVHVKRRIIFSIETDLVRLRRDERQRLKGQKRGKVEKQRQFAVKLPHLVGA